MNFYTYAFYTYQFCYFILNTISANQCKKIYIKEANLILSLEQERIIKILIPVWIMQPDINIVFDLENEERAEKREEEE